MKKISIIATLVFGLGLSIISFASPPPPPPGDHGENDNQYGGGAPVGSGIAILLGLGVIYGGKKLYDSRKEIMAETE